MKKTIIRTSNFFNLGTQRALYEKVPGYIDKETYIKEYIDVLRNEHNLEKIYRFDLGQNNDGCAREVENRFKELVGNGEVRKYLKNYPDFECRKLTRKIADLHKIPDENWVLISAGLDQMIRIIASTFLDLNDRIMVNAPSFYLFEEYSRRRGAIIVNLQLREEEDYGWTTETFDEYRDILKKLSPKIIWIANPNNPTGVPCPKDLIQFIIDEAANYFSFVILDEAYGEYVDPKGSVNSASAFIGDYDNLIVLRTFSKAYGLANLRIGYAITGNKDIIRALKIRSDYFPITQYSFDMANVALDNIDYLDEVRENTQKTKEIFTAELDSIPGIRYINSKTNIIMLKHEKLSDRKFNQHLEKHGIIVARVPEDLESQSQYIRMTLRSQANNKYFTDVLKEIRI